MSIFHPLEVVGRGSETQLHVGKNLNKIGMEWNAIVMYVNTSL